MKTHAHYHELLTMRLALLINYIHLSKKSTLGHEVAKSQEKCVFCIIFHYNVPHLSSTRGTTSETGILNPIDFLVGTLHPRNGRPRAVP